MNENTPKTPLLSALCGFKSSPRYQLERNAMRILPGEGEMRFC